MRGFGGWQPRPSQPGGSELLWGSRFPSVSRKRLLPWAHPAVFRVYSAPLSHPSSCHSAAWLTQDVNAAVRVCESVRWVPSWLVGFQLIAEKEHWRHFSPTRWRLLHLCRASFSAEHISRVCGWFVCVWEGVGGSNPPPRGMGCEGSEAINPSCSSRGRLSRCRFQVRTCAGSFPAGASLNK